jgi:putative salt-induced outer membrane protein YdiY
MASTSPRTAVNARSPLLPVVLALVIAPHAQAQINIEKQRSFDVDGVEVSLNTDVTLLSGNTQTVIVGGGGRLDVRKGKHYSFFLGNARYGESGRKKYQEHLFGHVRYNYDLKPWLVGEVFAQSERDAFTLLQVRLLAGGGFRLRYFSKENKLIGLYQGMALMYELEHLDAAKAGNHPARLTVGRWSNYLNLRLMLSENTHLVQTLYVQPRLDDFGDVRLLDEAALAIGFNKHLAFHTSFNLRYDSRPPDDVETLDLALRNGLTVTF